MKGRKPRPTHLRVLDGNPGKRPLNKAEPVAPGSLREPPDWLTEGQKESWRYALEHAPLGVLGKIDRGLLAVWVVAEDLHRDAAQKVAKFGSVVKVGADKDGKGGTMQQSPYLPIVNRQAQIMVKTAAELGFTPVARTRIGAGDGGSSVEKGNRFAGHGVRPA